jgi:hypothetical protein
MGRCTYRPKPMYIHPRLWRLAHSGPFEIREPTFPSTSNPPVWAMALPSSASATAPDSAGERWPPLESCPDVFNQVRRLYLPL